jgi:transcription initiation factor TFIIIB Brf1 subunit/transcription initiation factor TFIIB
MTKYICPVCKGKTCWYSYDGKVCINCGLVDKIPVISKDLAVV